MINIIYWYLLLNINCCQFGCKIYFKHQLAYIFSKYVFQKKFMYRYVHCFLCCQSDVVIYYCMVLRPSDPFMLTSFTLSTRLPAGKGIYFPTIFVIGIVLIYRCLLFRLSRGDDNDHDFFATASVEYVFQLVGDHRQWMIKRVV